MRQPGYLAERVLEAPHQLERALGVLGILERVQAGVARQRRQPLVQLRVVLHRARAERVEALVEVEVLGRERRVVAHDLGLGHLRQLGGPLAPGVRRQQLVQRHLGHVERRRHERPASLARALEDRDRVLVAARVERRGAHRTTSASRSRSGAFTSSASRSMSFARAALGDRHEQPVLVLGIVAAEPVAGVDPGAAGALEQPVEVRHAHGELAGHRAGVDRLEPQRLARVVGAAKHQLGQLHEAALAEPREVDHAGERVERLRGADVVRGLLAPDVLLAGLERQHEAAAPLQVARLAGDPARACAG